MKLLEKLFPIYTILMMIALMISSCSDSSIKKQVSDQGLTGAWADMTLFITQYTPANSPTFASRCLGYIGLTMYESIVHRYPEYRSLSGQLNGLDELPKPNPELTYNWELSLNAAQATILDSIYKQTSDKNKLKIDSLEQVYYQFFKSKVNDRAIINRSVEFGKSVALAIFEWSKTDGGHRGYLRNFDKDAVHPERPGSWKPPLYAQSFSHHPLHPHWGDNRTFLKVNAEIATPEMIPYDTMPGSPYYEQFRLVYEQELGLTQEEKEIAIWWSDDPDDTFTPPGHSYYLARLALRKEDGSLIECAETYAKVGMAVADAFIMCWKWKYHHFSERPNTFVPKFIDEQWESFWPDPPFPSFPSGHAIQAAAATMVLTDLFGDNYSFIDSAHVKRERDELRETDFVAQSFDSFWQVAEETADSRFYGGIHTHQDNQVGLDKGSEIAGNINQLDWKKDAIASPTNAFQ